jgi:guanine deaminase
LDFAGAGGMNSHRVERESTGIRVFLGSYIHSESKDKPLIIKPNGVIGVENGKIIFVDVEDNLEDLKEKYSFTGDKIYIIGRGEFLMPGLVDTHIHASQYPNAGLGLDLPLLEWLQTYTFPLEQSFHDTNFARSCYKKVVERTLNAGTTTASYFATIHRQSTEILGEIVDQYGQRGLIGKVCMDCYSPDNYCETTEESLASTEEFIVNMLKKKSSRVRPTITPRFALTCSEALMTGLGKLAKKYDVHIQTHLCESTPEVARALELFPKCQNYTEIYEKTDLLTDKTIMAHCVHMEKEEIELLAKTSTGVAHCPTSNMCILSGFCPVRRLLAGGVKVGLGTDCSGGYSSSILETMRHAIISSKCMKIQDPSYEQLTYKDVIFLATLGGAQALSMDKEIGNFQVGKYFDALHIDLASTGSAIHQFPDETLNQMIEKFVMLGDDRNICQVFVEGRKVKVSH